MRARNGAVSDTDAGVASTRYLSPPADVVRILDAPPTPWILPSPDGRRLLFVEHAPMPSLADLARPVLRLAGLRIDPAWNARHQASFGIGLVLVSIDAVHDEGVRVSANGGGGQIRVASESGRRIALPRDRRISSVIWSHTSERFACALVGEQASELWCADVRTGELVRLASGLHSVFGAGYEWMPDGRRLLCSLVPRGRGPAPSATALPLGPNVQETSGGASPLRTYRDLLATPHDEELFAYHAASELALVDSVGEPRDGELAMRGQTLVSRDHELATRDAGREARDTEPVAHDVGLARGSTELTASRALRFIGAPCIASSFDVAPGGDLVLVTRVTKPFSYLHGVYGFPHSIEVWNLRGERVHVVADVPTADEIPIEGVRLGPRGVSWCPHEDATLVWVEALDGGDPRRSATHRDRWLELAHPFDREPREIVRLEHRASHLSWMPDPARVLAREYDRDRRWTRAAVYDRYDVRAQSLVLDDRSQRDRYRDPGAIITRSTECGGRVVRQEGAWIFRAGEGESKEGARPFLDRQNLETLAIERVWRCEADAYEGFFAFVEDEARCVDRFLTRHESPRDPPNLRLRSPAISAFRAITRFDDPAPDLRGITKELVHYERDDGVALSGTLYLPAGYARTAPLPLVMWAYPRDFVDADTAGQVLETPNTFTRISGASHLFFLTQGYAVLDGASMPIIGDPGTMNDTFIEQSVAAARAAIEKLADLGLCDRSRVGIGGHSYGAFMAANLLAHSDLFRAGIARSGAYNRTLTPFGFQAERRSLWEARASYVELSPLMHADKIKAPLLLIHGADDDNPGTFPLQSERLFHALKGNGGTARYVELPHESHGYRARESVLHVLHEMFAWFDRFVKHAAVP